MTNLCLAQTLFKTRKQSSHQAMKIAREVNPDMNRTRELTLDLIENERLREKLMRTKGLYAHGAGCGSTHALQYDHIRPRATGGQTTCGNLRILCRNCNLRAAMNFYGEAKMHDFVRDVHRPYTVI